MLNKRNHLRVTWFFYEKKLECLEGYSFVHFLVFVEGDWEISCLNSIFFCNLLM